MRGPCLLPSKGEVRNAKGLSLRGGVKKKLLSVKTHLRLFAGATRYCIAARSAAVEP